MKDSSTIFMQFEWLKGIKILMPNSMFISGCVGFVLITIGIFLLSESISILIDAIINSVKTLG